MRRIEHKHGYREDCTKCRKGPGMGRRGTPIGCDELGGGYACPAGHSPCQSQTKQAWLQGVESFESHWMLLRGWNR